MSINKKACLTGVQSPKESDFPNEIKSFKIGYHLPVPQANKNKEQTVSALFVLLNIKLYEKSIVVSWVLAVNGFINYF